MLIRGFQYGGGSGGGGGASSDGPANAIQVSNGTGGFVGESAFSYDPATNTVGLASGVQTANNPAFNISQTWNNAAVTFTGLQFNATNTASGASSLLLDLQVGGISQAFVTRDGGFRGTYFGIAPLSASGSGFIFYGTGNRPKFRYAGVNAFEFGNNVFVINSTGSLAWASSGISGTDNATASDLVITRDAANTLAQRNTTNAQTFRVYNTYTDASNYERLAFLPGAASGWMQIAAQTAGTGTDNIGLALTPAGTGAISAQVPDNTAAGGNARGANAIDLQTLRSAATQVASGQSAAIVGGAHNTASAGWSFVGGGYANTASGVGAVVCGGAGGGSNVASGQDSFVGSGAANTASGQESVVTGGTNNLAGGRYSWVPGGTRATVRTLLGARAYASGRRSADGDAQIIGMVCRRTTSSTSATDLTADGGAISISTCMVLPNNSGAHFRARVAAYRSGGGAGSWEICGTIERGANAASTAIVGTTTIRAFGVSASLGAPTVDVVADTTQGAAVIRVIAGNSDTTYWVGDIELVQVA